jgi:hypothetical protein
MSRIPHSLRKTLGKKMTAERIQIYVEARHRRNDERKREARANVWRWLDRTLTDSGHNPDGCGMSTRPEYYSGRGATSSDLSSSSLEKLYKSIKKNAGADAAKAYEKMVMAIPVLSATDFLITLKRLVANAFVWDPSLVSGQKGIHVEDEGNAIGTFLSVFGGMHNRDETEFIRGPFARAHDLLPKNRRTRCDWGYTRRDSYGNESYYKSYR